jgi:site-specific recombinase XerD
MTTLRKKMKDEMQLKGLSSGTQQRYLREIIKLYEHYKQSPAKLEAKQIKGYLLYLVHERKLSASTYNVTVHALKFFYKKVLNRDIHHNDFPLSKEPKRLPDILSMNEVAAILKATLHIRQKAILALAYGAGLRLSEIAHLKLGDIDSKRMLLHIRGGKGNKDRYVILSPVMLKTLRIYWRQCRSKDLYKTQWIFPGRNPLRPISSPTVSKAFKMAKERAKITKRGGIHSLRHAFATHTLESGEDIYAIKQLLGHASIASTARYLRMTPNRMKSIVPPIESLKF